MTTRRDFLKLTLGSAAVAGASGLLGGTALAAQTRVPPGHIGIQLYTVRSLMTSRPQEVLDRLAEIGYETVGVSGLYGHTPERFRAMLDRAGLRAVLTHLSLDAVRGDWQRELDNAHVLGVESVVVPWLPSSLWTPEGYRRLADEFSEAGRAAREAGLRFLYHNHDFDFRTVDGQVLYDILLTETDPRYVNFEIDLYWAIHAGHDPVAYFERYPGRFPVFHVKDRAADGSFADVGHGTIDFRRLFRHRDISGVKEYVVEHDRPADPLASAARSYDTLWRLRF